MKKFISIILVAVSIMAVCLVGCGDNDVVQNNGGQGNVGNNDNQGNVSVVPGTATGDVSGDISTMINNATAADPDNFAVRAPYLDVITAEMAPQFLGLTEEEFNASVESAVFYESMIMPSNQSYCLVKVKDGVNTSDVQKAVFDNCNPRKWVCMSAEYVTVLADDDYVFLAMGPKSSCDSLKAEFATLAGSDMVEAMEKTVDEGMIEGDDFWMDDLGEDAIVDDGTITEGESGEPLEVVSGEADTVVSGDESEVVSE